jgi:acetoin utilization protein AcuC
LKKIPNQSDPSQRVGLVTVEDAARTYDFGATHPLRPERVLLTYDNITKCGLDAPDIVEELQGRRASDAEIENAHSVEYVGIVQALDDGSLEAREGLPYGLGTPDDPIFPGMHAAASAVCGATIVAAEAVASGKMKRAFNPAGGLHHARRSEASGFCIYNDPAVAIAHVLEMHPDWRVMYLDVDVHHGDGVQWIFYDNPQVLTLSLHQSGNYLYPGTGFEDEIGTGDALGTSANIPFMPFTGQDDYLWALGEVLPALAAAYKPHLLLTQLGADTHHGDPLANLGLTMTAYAPMAELIARTADEHCSGRWVATGGGGYQAETVVPKVWTIHFAEMCGRPEAVPQEWLVDEAPEDVSKSYRESVQRSVVAVLDACVSRLQALSR